MADLSHTVTGDGDRALLVLHGLFGSGRNWSGIARRLADTHRIYLVDLRNHGSSPWAATMSYAEMADDVAALIADEGISDPIVMGHSMGGKVAMRLALDRPALLRSLVVVDIAPVTYGHDMLDYIAAMQMLDLSGSQRRAELEEELAGEVEDPGVTSFLMTNLERANGGFQWRVNLTAITAAMSAIAAFSAPDGATYDRAALFVAGEYSAYIRPEHKQRIADLFPNARQVTIKNAGHWVHADQPDAFVKTLRAFLDAVG